MIQIISMKKKKYPFLTSQANQLFIQQNIKCNLYTHPAKLTKLTAQKLRRCSANESLDHLLSSIQSENMFAKGICMNKPSRMAQHPESQPNRRNNLLHFSLNQNRKLSSKEKQDLQAISRFKYDADRVPMGMQGNFVSQSSVNEMLQIFRSPRNSSRVNQQRYSERCETARQNLLDEFYEGFQRPNLNGKTNNAQIALKGFQRSTQNGKTDNAQIALKRLEQSIHNGQKDNEQIALKSHVLRQGPSIINHYSNTSSKPISMCTEEMESNLKSMLQKSSPNMSESKILPSSKTLLNQTNKQPALSYLDFNSKQHPEAMKTAEIVERSNIKANKNEQAGDNKWVDKFQANKYEKENREVKKNDGGETLRSKIKSSKQPIARKSKNNYDDEIQEIHLDTNRSSTVKDSKQPQFILQPSKPKQTTFILNDSSPIPTERSPAKSKPVNKKSQQPPLPLAPLKQSLPPSMKQVQKQVNQSSEQNPVVNQILYLMDQIDHLGQFQVRSKQFYQQLTNLRSCKEANYVAVYYLAQQFYVYSKFTIVVFEKEPTSMGYFTITAEELQVEKDQFQEEIQELKKDAEQWKKQIKKSFDIAKQFLKNDGQILRFDHLRNYHDQAAQGLTKEFKMLYQVYQKEKNSERKKKLLKRCCYLIQVFGVLKMLNGEEFKDYQDVDEIPDKKTYLNQYMEIFLKK